MILVITCTEGATEGGIGRSLLGHESDVDQVIGEGGELEPEGITMTNSWYTTILAVLIWLFMSIINVANLVFLGK